MYRFSFKRCYSRDKSVACSHEATIFVTLFENTRYQTQRRPKQTECSSRTLPKSN
jgi:hypothetical protein